MPDVALLEGRYCSVEHLTVAGIMRTFLDFLLYNQILSDWTYMYADPLNLKKLYVSVWRIMSNPRILISLPSGNMASGKVLEPFSSYYAKNRSVEMGRSDFSTCLTKDSGNYEAQYLLMKICL